MPRRQIRTVSLSQELDRFVADEVASGHYSTASEVIRAGLRTLIERQENGRFAQAEARRG
ncbi:putative addiction module CopG family antidote [Sphingomonas sp. BE138]|jgi:putative addiction module CopG family antidote|uniref:type II toxin-antitoxin system ParD family antitoxin n=1 Tax=Sphingomonas sp. BE138 TaxID=2817845 RepID=UPI002864BB5D|nr:type II toxin-antitoxin system ParD family antitoxin [Sphingomonas sp. BE138]MDR6790296.1 putative addiction module CopG family antidote [Sphingomonas sp. BE138]